MRSLLSQRLVVVLLCVSVGALALSATSAAANALFGLNGTEAGQVYGSVGMGIEQESGTVYVGDVNSNRVDQFEHDGSFVRSWGWGIINQADEFFQVCTTATKCSGGLAGPGVGEFSIPQGVAVDNDPLSASQGDVYVVDFSNYRVQKFDASGKFLLMFGGRVNKNGGDVCDAGEGCQQGTEGEADGEFNWVYGKAYIAVGPGGKVYVGNKGRVEVFEPSGEWKETISLGALSSEGRVTALAVNSAGDVYVKDEGVPGVREFEPNGAEMATKLDEEAGEAVAGIALDESGDVFVSEEGEPCACDFIKYSPSGKELDRFGPEGLKSVSGGMAFDEGLKELLVQGSTVEYNGGVAGPGETGVFALAPPPPGPLIEPGSELATPESRWGATLQASIDPEGYDTKYHFEYVDEAQYKSGGFTDAASTEAVSIGSTFADQHAEAKLPEKTFVPGVTYYWRVVAINSQGAASAEQGFEEAPSIEGPWVTDVSATSATLAAKLDPVGASTSYRLEYGASTSYGHVLTGSIGEGTNFVAISQHIQELEPDTTYHYRIVTTSELGTVGSVDHTFTTQLPGGSFTLSDGRGWELVSPADKKGALIEPSSAGVVQQASSEGNAVIYSSTGPGVGENATGAPLVSRVLSRRGPNGGWRSEDIADARYPKIEPSHLLELSESDPAFSSDLSFGIYESPSYDPPFSPSATERTIYLRDEQNGTYLPLVTPANVPPGTKFGGVGIPYGEGELSGPETNSHLEMKFVVATSDLSHVILQSPLALTQDATSVIFANCNNAEAPPGEIHDEPPYSCGMSNLYEWSNGQLKLVNVLPDGRPTEDEYRATKDFQGEFRARIAVGIEAGNEEYGVFGTYGTGGPHAISSDGRWIAWTIGDPYAHREYFGLYVRDMVTGKTLKVGGVDPVFQTMSDDGSRIFYREKGDLYEFNTATERQTDLTANHGPGEGNAGVKEGVIGASEDGSIIYFITSGVLGEGAVKGQNNLYILHDENGVWSTKFLATLSREDEKDWFGKGNYASYSTGSQTSARVSPNGRYLAFMSDRSLTGYDNADALSGQPDEEVFLYDAVTGRVACPSCNPTGTRPNGVDDKGNMMDAERQWLGRWLAANIPGSRGSHQLRSLSDSGRLFFNSSDALVPQDVNGQEDVYEYEPQGVGSCTSESATFGVGSGGCVDLISSGQSSQESVFLDASENGDDVFFFTTAKLTAEDYDNSYDIYDAHVCSTTVPCLAIPVSSPPCTSGDSCKAAPAPQPTLFGPAPSATFVGQGNVTDNVVSNGAVKHKLKMCAKSETRKKGKCIKKRKHARPKTRKRKMAKKGLARVVRQRGGKR